MSTDDRIEQFYLSPEARHEVLESVRSWAASEDGVMLAVAFGSFVRGESFRDLDLGLFLREPFDALELGKLAWRIWKAIGRPVFEIDVVPLNDAMPGFVTEVLREGCVLREAWPGDAHDRAVQAQSEWIDFQEAARIVAHDTEQPP